eukprot:m.6405 g.6405  ORF g.6405 m.6405 type:complete len:65 (-) comp2590_c0_seq1:446-640(-)
MVERSDVPLQRAKVHVHSLVHMTMHRALQCSSINNDSINNNIKAILKREAYLPLQALPFLYNDV